MECGLKSQLQTMTELKPFVLSLWPLQPRTNPTSETTFLSCTCPMPHAGNGEVCADVGVWFAFYEEVRVEKDEVSGRRRHLGVQLAHHVRQETMFAWHYHLQCTATVNQLLYLLQMS